MQISEGAVNLKQKKEKIVAIDFIRAACAVGIILYHLSCYTVAEAPKVFYHFANGSFGAVFVAVFFIVSGGVLYHNYPQITNLRQFYYKRWKSLFPMFYITWGYFYLHNVLTSGSFFYHGKKLEMLLTIFGVDGYFRYRGLNYYIVGEWFFGAIVMLYTLFPLLVKVVNKLGWKVLIGIIPLWIWQVETDIFTIPQSTNLIYCITIFVIGMLIFKYKVYRCKPVIFACLVISAVVLFVQIPGNDLYTETILGITLFFVLFGMGEILMKIPVLKNGISFVSSLTFPMFLVQNKVGYYLVEKFTPTSHLGVIKVIVVTLILCMLSGWCINAITNALFKTKWFGYLDKLSNKEKKLKKQRFNNGTN